MMKNNFSKLFEKIQKTSVTINYESTSKKTTLGSSKFGGNPHLPKDFQWPYYEGISYDDIAENRPLSFLAQINLDEIAEYDKDNILPSRGILYFFYELATMTWGFDPKDKGCARVYYYDCDISELVETSAPSEMDKEYVLPELQIGFSEKADLPSFEEFDDYYKKCDYDNYDKARAEFGVEISEEGDDSKLLGYADIVQNCMLLQCEKVTNGIYCGDNSAVISSAKKRELFENSKDWTLLLQVGTLDDGNDFELMWGDCGYIYFYIKKSDLANRIFDNVWLILQCG